MRDFALTIQLWVWLSFGLVGCAWLGFTPDESLDARRCATHSALGCTAKAALYCTVRGPMSGFIGCVVERSGICATHGVFECMHSTLLDPGEAYGNSVSSQEIEEVKRCCEGKEYDGRWDAVEMVAECYVDVCMGGE
jgi:hypothetical protein